MDHFFTRSSPQELPSGSNVSTHFHVQTPSRQNVRILELLTSLIAFRHCYNKGGEDVLKSFTPSFIKSAMTIPSYRAHLLLQVRWMKKAELEFLPFNWDKRVLKPKSTAHYAWKVMQKRLSLKPKCSIRPSRPWRLTQPSQYNNKLWRQSLCFILVCVISLLE